jgi:glycosyltransferase involved in cell wall biosynthesis
VVWLVHQFRQAYDFDRGEFRAFSEKPLDRATRAAIQRFDRVALGEAKRIFTISGNVAARLERYSGLHATVLPPPPQKLDYHTAGSDGFVLSVNRLDRYKRIDLLIDAAKAQPALRVVIVGDGPDRARLEGLASGENGRIRFAGRVDGDELADLYARCLAVYYAPVDEDYGMVPYEAFLSGKPVVTTTDAGGPLEVVHDGETGLVVAPDPADLARACAHLVAHPDEARSLGEAGKAVAERITWDACIEALLS